MKNHLLSGGYALYPWYISSVLTEYQVLLTRSLSYGERPVLQCVIEVFYVHINRLSILCEYIKSMK